MLFVIRTSITPIVIIFIFLASAIIVFILAVFAPRILRCGISRSYITAIWDLIIIVPSSNLSCRALEIILIFIVPPLLLLPRNLSFFRRLWKSFLSHDNLLRRLSFPDDNRPRRFLSNDDRLGRFRP